MKQNRNSYELRNPLINSYCKHLFSIKLYCMLSTSLRLYHLHLRTLKQCLYQWGFCLSWCNKKPYSTGLICVYFPHVTSSPVLAAVAPGVTCISGSFYVSTWLSLVWFLSSCLSLCFASWSQVAGHFHCHDSKKVEKQEGEDFLRKLLNPSLYVSLARAVPKDVRWCQTFSLQLSASLISVSSTPFSLSLFLFKNTDRFSSCDSGEAEERSMVKVSSSMITSGLNDPREREFILLSVFTENTALVWIVCPYLGQ